MPTLQVVSLDSSWQGMSGEGVGLLIWIAQDTELHGSEGLSCLKFVFLMGRGEGCGSGERDTGKGLKIVYPPLFLQKYSAIRVCLFFIRFLP